jgi:hypothetical protein
MARLRQLAPTLLFVFFAANGFCQSPPVQLAEVLQRAGARVQRYTGNILSVVCTEVTKQQELESDLKTAKNKPADLVYDFIILPPERPGLSIREMRELKLVNGKPAQKKTRASFPDGTAYTTSIVMLLPENQTRYTFSDAGKADLDGREVLIVDFMPAKLEASIVKWNGPFFSFRFQTKGRIWIDPSTYDVLRMDTHMIEPFEIKSPTVIRKGGFVRFGPRRKFRIESWDVSIRFRATSLQDLTEPIVLPETAESLRIIQGSRIPRLRTTHSFKDYRRFTSEIKLR